MFYLGLGAFLSIAINVMLLSVSVHSTYLSPFYNPNSPIPLRDLEQPSPYIGLERVVRPKNMNSSISFHRSNFPGVLMQISARDKPFVSLITVNRMSTFRISNDISMIAQFRAGDYGLIRCSINSFIPSVDSILNTTKVYNSTGNTRGLHVDVWQLAFETELDPNMLSLVRHGRSPLSMPRQNLLGTLDMSAGNNSRTRDFDCVSGTWYTFEFIASSQNFGEVMFRQDHAYPTLGIYMHQDEANQDPGS